MSDANEGKNSPEQSKLKNGIEVSIAVSKKRKADRLSQKLFVFNIRIVKHNICKNRSE